VNKKEPIFFLALVLASTFPILLNVYFPSLDGPAHLYNARLTWELIWGSPVLESYLHFHPVPVPNWIANAILTPLCQLMPSYLAEKLMLLGYSIGLPFSFRYLIRSINGNILLSYYILPFIFSNMMMSGFYNFSFAILFCFFTLGFFFTNRNNLGLKKLIALGILLLLVYFSHVFVAAFTMAILVSYPLVQYIFQSTKENITTIAKTTSVILLSTLPCLVLCVVFSTLQPSQPNYYFVSKQELWKWLYTVRPIIAYQFDLEGNFTQVIFLILILQIILITIYNVKRIKFKTITTFYCLLPLLLLILVFILPDGDGWAGYISIRTLYLFFVFLIFALSSFYIPTKFQIGLLVLVLTGHFLLLARKNSSLIHKQFLFTELSSMAESIRPYSIVGTVDLSEDYRTAHISNYLGTFKPLVITENYEATTGYFPIQWRQDIPAFKIGNLTIGKENIQGVLYTEQCTKNADYVLLMGGNSNIRLSENRALFEQLQLSYYLFKQSDFFSLYKLK
jgi:hypothetical protein